MAGLFLFAAAVQHNDPDPVRWGVLYGSAGVCSFLYWKGLRVRFAVFALALLSFTWALALAVGELPAFPPVGELIGRYAMSGSDVEVIREIGGLVLVSIWMAVIGLREDRSSHT
ncbi:MAG: transmembrane 220 family protein [Ignavibacteria bacterium]|nr:transmembrane 220 family protein [Ignavibacteria bacterium]